MNLVDIERAARARHDSRSAHTVIERADVPQGRVLCIIRSEYKHGAGGLVAVVRWKLNGRAIPRARLEAVLNA